VARAPASLGLQASRAGVRSKTFNLLPQSKKERKKV
jgi:hypothetical protein